MKSTKKVAPPDDVLEPPVETRIASRGRALVFVSHDSRDADLAEAFSNLLTDVSAGMLKSFRASDKKGTTGIAFGAEWYKAIMSQIEESTDVVALLTPQSIERPWILYEAGVAKGKLETTVLGVALGAQLDTLSTGPFGQFQNCGDDEDSLTKLVMQLLTRNPDAAPREEAVRMQVQIFRTKMSGILASRGKQSDRLKEKEDDVNVGKLFEEVKAMVRELPERVDDRVRSASKYRSGRKFGRIHPGMMEDFLFNPRFETDEEGFAIGFLIFISLYRDDFPWIYEPGLELYRALISGQSNSISGAHRRLMKAIEASHNPMLFESNRGFDEDLFMLARELSQILEHVLIRKRRTASHSVPRKSLKSPPSI